MIKQLTCLLIILVMSQALFAANNKLPVSELHVHAEAGVLTPALADYLAKKNHTRLSSKDIFRDGVIYHKPGVDENISWCSQPMDCLIKA